MPFGACKVVDLSFQAVFGPMVIQWSIWLKIGIPTPQFLNWLLIWAMMITYMDFGVAYFQNTYTFLWKMGGVNPHQLQGIGDSRKIRRWLEMFIVEFWNERHVKRGSNNQKHIYIWIRYGYVLKWIVKTCQYLRIKCWTFSMIPHIIVSESLFVFSHDFAMLGWTHEI